jgi:hypothetical protein
LCGQFLTSGTWFKKKRGWSNQWSKTIQGSFLFGFDGFDLLIYRTIISTPFFGDPFNPTPTSHRIRHLEITFSPGTLRAVSAPTSWS